MDFEILDKELETMSRADFKEFIHELFDRYDRIHNFWITDRKCEYGYFADLTKLPTGTTFNVVNGAWRGKIVEKDNQKYIVCGAKLFSISGDEDLVIEDVRIPNSEVWF